MSACRENREPEATHGNDLRPDSEGDRANRDAQCTGIDSYRQQVQDCACNGTDEFGEYGFRKKDSCCVPDRITE